MPLRKRPPTSPVAERMIRSAFHELESVVSAAHSRDFASTTLENVQQAAVEIENQLAARQSLRNMRRLMPLFTGLGYYSKAIDVLCNGTPFLPWIWAPIKLILKIASDYAEAFEHIIKAYASIAGSLRRFKLFEETFTSKPEFQETLAVFYTDILSFHKVAYLFVKRNCWKTLFLSSWGRFQRRFGHILESLQKHGEQIDKEANAHDIAEAREMREKLEEWRLESLRRLAEEEKAKISTQFQAVSTWLKADDSDQSLISDQISEEGLKHPGTCSWTIEHKTMSSWLRCDPEVQFLWLQGNPGTGKSIISGQLTGFLRAARKSVVIRHHCTYAYESSTRYDEILKSLLLQMIREDDATVSHVYEEYVVAKRSVSVPLLEQLISTTASSLAEGISQSHAVHIVIDGLDEVEDKKARAIVRLLDRLTKDSIGRGAVCKVLIVCRDTLALEATLRRKPTLRMGDEKEKTTDAIRIYSEQRLKAESPRLAQLGLRGNDIKDLSKTISIKADGMFLWARLVLDCLSTNMFYTRHEVLSAVNTLPRKLSEFYEGMLTQMMSKFDSRSVSRMKSILGWVAYAKRPLRKTEFRAALMFSLEGFASELVPSFIFDMCKPLIEERRDSTFTFIHVSVKDYLRDPSSTVCVGQQEAEIEQCYSIVACLLSGLDILQASCPVPHRHLRVAKGLHGFHVYAHEYWMDHLFNPLRSGLINHYPQCEQLVEALSGKLAMLTEAATTTAPDLLPGSLPILDVLRSYEGLCTNAKMAVQEKTVRTNLKHVDLGKDEDSAPMTNVKSLRDVLMNYQATIREVLSLQDIGGVTRDELSRFKQEFGALAFPCRLPECPHSISGFQDASARLKHEATHTQRLQCQFTGCQYPPFVSARALRNHEIKCHITSLGSTRIRSRARTQIARPPAKPLGAVFPKNPMTDDDLANFDFDSFLHDGDQEAGTFDFSARSFGMEGTKTETEKDQNPEPPPSPPRSGMDFVGGLDFKNPLTSDNVLTDFDFDSFLHDAQEPFDFSAEAFGMGDAESKNEESAAQDRKTSWPVEPRGDHGKRQDRDEEDSFEPADPSSDWQGKRLQQQQAQLESMMMQPQIDLGYAINTSGRGPRDPRGDPRDPGPGNHGRALRPPDDGNRPPDRYALGAPRDAGQQSPQQHSPPADYWGPLRPPNDGKRPLDRYSSSNQPPSSWSPGPQQQAHYMPMRDERGYPVHDSRAQHQHSHSLSGAAPLSRGEAPPPSQQPYPNSSTPGPGQPRDPRDPGPPRSFTPAPLGYDNRGPPQHGGPDPRHGYGTEHRDIQWREPS